MTTVNMHGWEILLPNDVEVVWDGIKDTTPDHVKVLSGKFSEAGYPVVETGTANGTINFNLHAVFETDPDHYLLMSGPPNYFIDGAKPMSGLFRTDFYHYNPLQFSWMMTTPNKPVVFPKGMPFAFFFNYPKNLLEETDISIRNMTDEEHDRVNHYNMERQKFYQENEGLSWSHFYRDGVDGRHEGHNKYLDKTFKPNPKEPRIEG